MWRLATCGGDKNVRVSLRYRARRSGVVQEDGDDGEASRWGAQKVTGPYRLLAVTGQRADVVAGAYYATE